MKLSKLFESILREERENKYITKNGNGPSKGKNVYYGFGDPEDPMGIWMCNSPSAAAGSVYETNYPMRVFEYIVTPGIKSKVVNLYDESFSDIDDDIYQEAKKRGIVAYINGEDMLYAEFGLLDPSFAKKTGNSVMIDWTNENDYEELLERIENEEENIWKMD
jgi:hypothetical protein